MAQWIIVQLDGTDIETDDTREVADRIAEVFNRYPHLTD